MLRQFHFIDQNGKDQGINVRNRSSELVKLLGDVELIRTERKKARANRNKFSGFEGGMGVGGSMSGSGSRYGGFGSDSLGYGGYSGGVFGDGGGFGGASSEFQDTGRRSNRFEEYDEYEEGDASPPRRRGPTSSRDAQRQQPKPAPPKEPEPDLVDFGDDEPPATTSAAAGKQPASSGNLDILESKPVEDDDFDDFQSATPAPAPAAAPVPTQQRASSSQFSIPAPASTASTTSSTQFAAPKPVSGAQAPNLNGLAGFTSMTASPSSSGVTSPTSPTMQPQQKQPQAQPQLPKPTGYQAATPNYFTSVAAGQPASSAMQSPSAFASPAASTASGPKPSASASASKPTGGDAFGSLWSSASASAGVKKTPSASTKGPNLASMAKEKASAGIWGAPAQSAGMHSPSPSVSQPGASQPQAQPRQQQGSQTGSSGLDDLLG